MKRKELTRSEIIALGVLNRQNILVAETYYESGIYGINWPGKGTKTVSETLQFIETLKKAIKLANRINKRMKK